MVLRVVRKTAATKKAVTAARARKGKQTATVAAARAAVRAAAKNVTAANKLVSAYVGVNNKIGVGKSRAEAKAAKVLLIELKKLVIIELKLVTDAAKPAKPKARKKKKK